MSASVTRILKSSASRSAQSIVGPSGGEGGMAEWRTAEWKNGRMAEWQGYILNLPDIFMVHTIDDDSTLYKFLR